MLARPIQIIIRLNAEEHEKLKKYTQKTGYTQSAYIRALLNKNVPKEKPGERFYDVIRKLTDIGNSMFQMAQQDNTVDKINAEYFKEQAELLRQFRLEIREHFILPEKIK